MYTVHIAQKNPAFIPGLVGVDGLEPPTPPTISRSAVNQ